MGKIRTEADAHKVLQYLLMNNKIARATHNMWAFRVWDETKNAQVNGGCRWAGLNLVLLACARARSRRLTSLPCSLDTIHSLADCDDDGEDAAGGKLAELLAVMRVNSGLGVSLAAIPLFVLPTSTTHMAWLTHAYTFTHVASCGATDVMVVVSRWFGGILLGPSRFRLINNTARQLLEQCALDGAEVSSSGGKSGAKKGSSSSGSGGGGKR